MKPRLLFFSSRPPFPPLDGTREHILSELRALAPFWQLDLFIVSDEKFDPGAREELEKIIGGKIFFFYQSRCRRRLKALAKIFAARPLQVSYFYSRAAAKEFNRILKNYELFYCHTLRGAAYFLEAARKQTGITEKTWLDFNDAISANYTGAVKNASGLWRWIYILEKNRIKNYELELLKTFPHSSIVTARDRDFIYAAWGKKYGLARPRPHEIAVQRYGVADPLRDYQYDPQTNNLVFIGNLYYPPNRQGLRIFCEKIWPLILAAAPQTELLVIGRGGQELLAPYPRVKALGFLPDPYKLMSEQAAFLNPINFGAGISTKTVLALALGLPIISTAIGLAGLENIADQKNILTIDYRAPQQAATAILEFLSEKDERRNASLKEKELARSLYSLEKNNAELITALKQITTNNDERRQGIGN